MTDLDQPDLPQELLPLMRTVLDAVVVITADGRVVGWNAKAEEIFIWSEAEARGRSLSDLIIPVQHRAAHEAGLHRIGAGEDARVLNRLIEIAALRSNGSEIPVELSITRAETRAGHFFVGFIRDISERRRAEQALQQKVLESRLMFEMTQMAAEADSYEEALEQGLRAISEVADWPVGHAFSVSASEPLQIHSTDIWYERDAGIARDLREATNKIEWKNGLGLPGTILATGDPAWISDVENEDNFFRKNLGFRGAFGFPLQYEGRPIAILEFFSRSPSEPDPLLLLTVRSLGEQIGRVFERRRRQDREGLLVRELQHRIKNIMAVVNAIALQTFRDSQSPEVALDAFLARLVALGEAHKLMFASDVHEVGLHDAVMAAVKGTGNSTEKFRIEGENVQMPGDVATSIILALHELCTNAMKYGALSNSDGHVEIKWGRSPMEDYFRFEWKEVGGPPVDPPKRQGFGTVLLKRMLASQFHGDVQIDYKPSGLHLVSTTPLPVAFH